MSTFAADQPIEIVPPKRPGYELAHPWIAHCMRIGFAARGVLYAAIGIATLWSIAHDRRRARGGMSEAFISISRLHIYFLRPGNVLLAGLALGFAGFALGMAWTAFFDWNDEGRSMLGIVRRIGTFIGGVGHLGLVVTALFMILGRQPDDHEAQRWSEWALHYPGGRIGVAIAGAWAAGYGLFLLSKTVTGRLDNKLEFDRMSLATVRWTNATGRFGMLARGAIYVTIGIVMLVAGYVGTAGNVVGFGGAMHAIAQDTLGWVALSGISAGLLSYGIFMVIEARYRRIGRKGQDLVT